MSNYGPPGGYPGQPEDPWQQGGQPGGYGAPYGQDPQQPQQPPEQPQYGPGPQYGGGQPPPYGQQPPAYGQQPPPYGGDPYAQPGQPMSGQPMSGQPMSGQPMSGQPMAGGGPGMGPPPYGGAGWQGTQQWNPPPKKGRGPLIALIIMAVLVLIGGVSFVGWAAFADHGGDPTPAPSDSASASASPSPSPSPSESPSPSVSPTPDESQNDAYTVEEGQCVTNKGSDKNPRLVISDCTSGSYKVLKRFTGTHDTSKCDNVKGATAHYYLKHDSSLSDLDFVLCLQEQ